MHVGTAARPRPCKSGVFLTAGLSACGGSWYGLRLPECCWLCMWRNLNVTEVVKAERIQHTLLLLCRAEVTCEPNFSSVRESTNGAAGVELLT